MRAPVTVFLSLLVLFGAAASAYAQGIEWETLNAEVMSLYQKGQYDRAVVVAKQALDVAEKVVGSNHAFVATTLKNMAALYRATNRAKKAEAQGSCRHAFGPLSDERATKALQRTAPLSLRYRGPEFRCRFS